nr:FtsX-like permease family protein [Aquimarina amphilecti]
MLLILSVSLAIFIIQIKKQLYQHLDSNSKHFDMVIGAKGSPLQLVLSSILHLDNPTGNIYLEEAIEVAKNPMVKDVIPISYGDNYNGYRILGASHKYLNKYDASLRNGQLYKKSLEVVIGSNVYENNNLQVGSTFASSHGLVKNGIEIHKEKPFVVTGVLKPTGSIVDHLIITNLESIWQLHEHEDEHQHENDHPEEEHEGKREITSLLVAFRNPMGAIQMSRFVNEKTTMQAALPKFEIERLMSFLGLGFKTINGISIAILLVALLSIFVNVIKTVRERKQELALLRTYGVSIFKLMQLVFLESMILALIGVVFGWILGRTGIWFFSIFSEGTYGYHFVFSAPSGKELYMLVLILLTTFPAAILASLSLLKLNVSKILADA